jgi:hypothetical protein
VRSAILLVLLLGLVGCGAAEEGSSETKPASSAAPEVFDPSAYRGVCMDIYLLTGGDFELSSELDAAGRARCGRLVERAGEACVRLVPGYRRPDECLHQEVSFSGTSP